MDSSLEARVLERLRRADDGVDSLPEQVDQHRRDDIVTPLPGAKPDTQDPVNVSMLRVLFRRSGNSDTSSPAQTESILPSSSTTTSPRPQTNHASLPSILSSTSIGDLAASVSTPKPQLTTLPHESEEITRLKADLRVSQVKYIQASGERNRLKETVASFERELETAYGIIHAELEASGGSVSKTKEIEEEIKGVYAAYVWLKEENAGVTKENQTLREEIEALKKKVVNEIPGDTLSKIKNMEEERETFCKAYLAVQEESNAANKENQVLREEVEALRKKVEMQATMIRDTINGKRPRDKNPDNRISTMEALIERQKTELSRLNKQVQNLGSGSSGRRR